MRKINGEVLMVVQRYPHRPQTFIVNELRELIAQGVDVRLLTLRGINRKLMKRWPEAAATAPRVISGNVGYRTRHKPFTIACAWIRCLSSGMIGYALSGGVLRTKQLLAASAFSRLGRFEIIHYQSGGLARLFTSMDLPHHQHARVFVSVRGKEISIASGDQLRSGYARTASVADTILPVCDAFARKLVQQIGFPQSKIQVHYSGIYSAYFSVDEQIQTKRDTSQEIVVYSAGRLTRKKGVTESVQAFAAAEPRVRQAGLSLRLVVAGNGPQRDAVKRLVGALGISSLVELRGVYGPEAHRDQLAASHIFVSHNVTAEDGDQEGIPNVLKEAMAAGLPVVATNHSGTPELVEDGLNGFLVEEFDVAATADRIVQLALDPALRRAMGERGRTTVTTRFDIGVTSAQLRDLYKRQ